MCFLVIHFQFFLFFLKKSGMIGFFGCFEGCVICIYEKNLLTIVVRELIESKKHVDILEESL